MGKFIPKDRSGKPIKNYRKRHEFIIPGVPSGVKVPGTSAGDVEKALKIFKRQMKDSGTLEELRDRRYFIKESKKRVHQTFKDKNEEDGKGYQNASKED